MNGVNDMSDLLCTETETIDKLFLELAQFTKARTANDLKLEKLLYAVSIKHPGESRFDTALRYMQQAEQQHNEPGKQST